MSRDFNETRQALKYALEKQHQLLADHRKMLDAFNKAFSDLDASTPDSVGKLIQMEVRRETQKVLSIERNIRDIQRDLNGKYSLRPAC